MSEKAKQKTEWHATRAGIVALIGGTDSPIEAILALHIVTAGIPPGWAITPQYGVETEAGSYRLDLALTNGKHRIAVEADGHEFHERTPERVTRDNDRTNTLQACGWLVMRFSGSQVARDPSGCARRVIEACERRTVPSVPPVARAGDTPMVAAIKAATARGDVSEENRLLREVAERARQRTGCR